ncbi:hypothetical protein QTP88_006250 [Uroleucon formosanum]
MTLVLIRHIIACGTLFMMRKWSHISHKAIETKIFTKLVDFSFKKTDALKDTSTVLKQRNRIVVGELVVVAALQEYPLSLRPKYWGVLNPLWKLCSIGKRQSPIDIDPDKLLFDPFLKNLHIDKDKVSGTIENTGQSLVFRVDKESKYVLNITEGPLTYRYQFQEFYIHFGTDNNLGSEHKIQGYSFPAEK